MDNLTKKVIERARELGADLVGIAPVERFKGAPLRMSPNGLLPEAKSVIVVAIHHPDATIELSGEPTPHDIDSYAVQSTAMNPMLDDISFLLARFLEDRGYKALPIAASNIWRYRGYKDLEVNFAPDLAHRYAAVAAGLGEIGWNGLCLTPEFGPRQRFVSIITNAELSPSPMYEGEPLCDKCMECVKNCPTDAFRKEVKKINEIEIGGKVYKFPDTNKWRCAWAENFGLSLAYKIPEKVDEEVILEYLAKYGRHIGEIGSCLRFCMVPQKRYYDISYSRAPRRRKEILIKQEKKLLDKIKEICEGELVDIVAIGIKEDFVNDLSIRPEYYLPDVNSIISIGIKVPKEKLIETQEIKNTILRRINYTQFKIAHLLDMSGYSAICNTVAPDNLIAHRLGIYEPETFFSTIFTSASLPSIKERRVERKENLEPEILKRFCREIGADLVGFFNKDRYERFCKLLTDLRLFQNESKEEVIDIGKIYGPYVPMIKKTEDSIKRLDDWVPKANSVIVLGLHFPNASLDTAKVTPAETVGPYAFVQYETLNLLSDMAYKVVKRLNDNGYRATFTFDITGLASKIKNSRGMLPDMRAHSIYAFLSGLSYIGLHGYPITTEYGVRQRFIAIISDLSLPNDPIYSGEILCENCSKPCISACPTSAISYSTIPIDFEGIKIKIPKFDSFACDWAKRYCLVGEEGPYYWNVDVNIPVPKEKRIEDVVDSVSKTHWGVQKLHINIVEECLRKCIANGKFGT